MMMVLTLLFLFTFGFLEGAEASRRQTTEGSKVKGCPRVRPHSPEYLHYLMQHSGPDSDVQSGYITQPADSAAGSRWPIHLPFSFYNSRVGLSDENTGFQPIQEQEIADKCINVPQCDTSARYRSLNGSCNNFNFPMWGVAGSAMVRLLPAQYQDGVNKVRKSTTGKDLPNVRVLRTTLFPDKCVPDEVNVLMVMQWGQLIAHDTTHIQQQDSGDGGLDCCGSSSQSRPSSCLPIQVPNDDDFYSQHNKTCLNFVRSMTTTNVGCKLSPQQQIAAVTHFVDASFVYGSDDKTAKSLRTFREGKLRVQLTSDKREFPPNSKTADRDCDNEGSDNVCYNAGDDRVNQNTGVTVLQVLMLREHNRVCDELLSLNPHWEDELVYQEARRVVVAEVQRISYDVYLPIILGRQSLKKLNIEDGHNDEPLKDNDYDPFLNPTTVNSFAAAAFRSFHSMVPRDMVLYDDYQKPIKTLILDNYFFRPSIIQEQGMMDNLLRGLAMQRALTMDTYFSKTITDLLFKSNKAFGTDLESTDLQRGRDHGLPVYNDFRVACGLPKAETFKCLQDVMTEETTQKLSTVYEQVNDVDLFVGGMSEKTSPGTLLGPTFQCIIGEQFKRWRNGDRFYYEFGKQAGSFQLEQLIEIRKVTLAEIICKNGDSISKLQPDVFHALSEQNQVKPCSEIISSGMNLAPWKER